jgi:glycogen(starch) synthase
MTALRTSGRRPRPSRLFMTADAGDVFRYAVELIGGLAPSGVATTLALLGPRMSASQRARLRRIENIEVIETGLPLDRLAEDEESVIDGARRIAALAEGADIVHLNTPALALADYPAPVVVAAHSCLESWWESVNEGPSPADFLWRTRLTRHGLRRADVIVCPSRAFARELRAIYGCEPIAVHNGCEATPLPETFHPAPCAFTAGRLWDEGENVATMDAAARRSGIPFLAAGPRVGPDGAAVAPIHLRLLGRLSEAELATHLARRPIFVSAALYQPFGLAVLEAAQAGCALVLSEIASFRELWDGAAVFVPARDARALAVAVARIAADAALRADLGAAAQRRAAAYTACEMASRMSALYAELISRRRGAAA